MVYVSLVFLFLFVFYSLSLFFSLIISVLQYSIWPAFPTTSTVIYTQTLPNAKPSRRRTGQSRDLWCLLFRRDGPSSASTTAFWADSSSSSAPSPQSWPRKGWLLHWDAPDSSCVASSLADSEFKNDHPFRPTFSSSYEFGPTSAVTTPSITDATGSPPSLLCTNTSGRPSPSLRTAHYLFHPYCSRKCETSFLLRAMVEYDVLG
jgi:hypothetical protein